VVVGWSRCAGKVQQFSGNVLETAFRWVARLVTALHHFIPRLSTTVRHFTSVLTPAQPFTAIDCFNERAMTKRYDPEQVTHPLDVAQSAAWVGGASGTYQIAVAFPPCAFSLLFKALCPTLCTHIPSRTAYFHLDASSQHDSASTCQAISRANVSIRASFPRMVRLRRG
jgi:hypothetical protein